MQLVVGLGNPGPAYAVTRHNLGFRVVDALAGLLNLNFVQEGSLYSATEITPDRDQVVLLKPLTYMNLSGQALLAWSKHHAVALSGEEEDSGVTPVVVCDDLALPLGSLRIRSRGSAGGQKGLASLLGVLGSEEIPRVRLGIGPPDSDLVPEAWSEYVLEPFASAELELAEELVTLAADAVIFLLTAGAREAAARFNRRPDPPVA